jgi:hypothetical protein
MARRSPYKGDKFRRQLEKKKKQDEKRKKKQNKDEEAPAEEDTSYMEYLMPGGPMDERFVDPEEEDNGEQDDHSRDNNL